MGDLVPAVRALIANRSARANRRFERPFGVHDHGAQRRGRRLPKKPLTDDPGAGWPSHPKRGAPRPERTALRR